MGNSDMGIAVCSGQWNARIESHGGCTVEPYLVTVWSCTSATIRDAVTQTICFLVITLTIWRTCDGKDEERDSKHMTVLERRAMDAKLFCRLNRWSHTRNHQEIRGRATRFLPALNDGVSARGTP